MKVPKHECFWMDGSVAAELLVRDELGRYGLPVDGGPAWVIIYYCPGCGFQFHYTEVGT